MEPDYRDHCGQMLTRIAKQLAEHMSSVQIICTLQQDDETYTIAEGAGDYFARYGATRAWLLRQEDPNEHD